jgi:hypothetical protein
LSLKEETSITRIIQAIDTGYTNSLGSVLRVHGYMLSKKSLDLLLAVDAATRKVKTFAKKFMSS